MKKVIYFLCFIVCLYFVNHAIARLQINVPHVAIPPQLTLSGKLAKKAIVVGATSGMGRQVAKLLANNGYEVGIVGRRKHLLSSLQQELPTKSYLRTIDVSDQDSARKQLNSLIKDMGGLDLMVVSVSCLGDLGAFKKSLDRPWNEIKKYLNVDTCGFWVSARVAAEYFFKQGHGHLVGVSSIDGMFGSPAVPEYSAAKAFISKYLDGVRNNAIQQRLPIFVTEVIPGPVDVERCTYTGKPGIYWVSQKEGAAQQIYDAIVAKKEYAYITRRWRLIGFLMQVLPNWLLRRLEL